MRKLLLLFAILLVGGCATVSKVEQGDQAVADRLAVSLQGPWNKFEGIAGFPVPTWTMEGIWVDRLQFYVGIKDGSPIVPEVGEDGKKRPLTFQASMQPHEVVALFQTLLTRDGSTFTLDKLDPAPFLGGPGMRFEFSIVRKVDDVRLSGFVYARIQNNELFAMLYQAPRLGFYPRLQPQVEKMAQTARLRG
jgi:hypothetical protein